MPITEADARAALAEITITETRHAAARAYHVSGPILMLWGAVWLVAYTATDLLPPTDWGLVWIPADLVGIGVSAWLARRAGGRRGSSFAVIGVASFVLIGALYAILAPSRQVQFEAIPPLLIAYLYAVLGAVKLSRFVLIGAVLAAATLFGYFLLPAWFGFWMAAIGGGALMLSGYWLGRA